MSTPSTSEFCVFLVLCVSTCPRVGHLWGRTAPPRLCVLRALGRGSVVLVFRTLQPALPYVQASGSARGEPGLLSGGRPRVRGHLEVHKSDGNRACGQSPCMSPLGRVCTESQLWPECRSLGGHTDAGRQRGEPPAPRAERGFACCFSHSGRRGCFVLVVKTQQHEIFA